MDAKNGGPAFPVFIAAGAASADDVKRAVDAAGAVGLTVWDWFAGNAMQGYLASFSGLDVRLPTPELVVRDVTRYADAMLAARPKPASDVTALVEALEAALMVMTSKEVRLEQQADAITMVRSQLAAHRKGGEA